jgi:membrane protease YdiL (CAAX protease family)
VPKLGLYFLGGLIFGTIAYLTNSLYAAMIVHSVADLEGFLLLWPHDARHALMTDDPLFPAAVAVTAIFVPVAIWALARLAHMTRQARQDRPAR